MYFYASCLLPKCNQVGVNLSTEKTLAYSVLLFTKMGKFCRQKKISRKERYKIKDMYTAIKQKFINVYRTFVEARLRVQIYYENVSVFNVIFFFALFYLDVKCNVFFFSVTCNKNSQIRLSKNMRRMHKDKFKCVCEGDCAFPCPLHCQRSSC